jgi:hypothetical protein
MWIRQITFAYGLGIRQINTFQISTENFTSGSPDFVRFDDFIFLEIPLGRSSFWPPKF